MNTCCPLFSMLEREFDRFGAIQKIDHNPGDTQAFIQYESIDAATVRLLALHSLLLHRYDRFDGGVFIIFA